MGKVIQGPWPKPDGGNVADIVPLFINWHGLLLTESEYDRLVVAKDADHD